MIFVFVRASDAALYRLGLGHLSTELIRMMTLPSDWSHRQAAVRRKVRKRSDMQEEN